LLTDVFVPQIGTGPSLLPASPAARATMEQWISAINCYVALLDRAYAGGSWIAGDALSLVDLHAEAFR